MGMSWYNGFSPEERNACAAWFNDLVRRGKVQRYTACVICGVHGGLIDQHREDYSAPFRLEDDIPTCFRCHMFIHTRARFPKEWDRYRAEIRAGWRYEPIHRREFQRFLAETVFRSKPVRRKQGTPPARAWLDEIHAGALCPPGRSPVGNWTPPEKGKQRSARVPKAELDELTLKVSAQIKAMAADSKAATQKRPRRRPTQGELELE